MSPLNWQLRRPSLSETPSSSTSSPPRSHPTSSSTCSDQEVSLGQWLPNKHPHRCEAMSQSVGELPLSPGDVRWNLKSDGDRLIPPRGRSWKTRPSRGQRGALLAASMNLKSSQASFSSSSSSAADVNDTIVGTHSMGISEGEVRRSVGRNNNPVVRPLAKFASHGRTLNTITTTTKISDEEIDDEDTFAGVPSITDSPAPQNSGTKVRQSLPITHQLSPGEVRRPFLHHSSQPAVVDTDVSMPLSIGEVPHTLRNKTTVGSTKVPKLASLDKHTDITPHRVAHSEHHSFSAPSDNFENETRDGIDVINVSRNRDQSFSSPAASYTLSPSSPLIISSSEPPATHSPTTRLIRVSEAPQEPSSPDSHLYRQGRQIPTQAPPLAATSLLSSHSKPTNLKGVSSPSRPVQAGHSYQSENMINSGSNHRANLHSTPLSSNQLKRQQPHLQAVRVVAALDDKEHEHRRENSMLHQEESEERADQQLVDSSLPTLTFTAVSSDYSTLSSTTSF